MKTQIHIQRKTGFILALLGICFGAVRHQAADPRTNSWFTTYSGQYARIYTSDVNKTNGMTSRLGPTVRCSRCRLIAACRKFIRRRTGFTFAAPDWAVYVMGPWYLNAAHTNLFPNFPINEKASTGFRAIRRCRPPRPSTAAGRSAILWTARRCSTVGTPTLGTRFPTWTRRTSPATGTATRM